MKRDFRFNFANSLMCECVICSWLRVLLSPVFRLCHPLLPLSWPWPLTLSLSLVPPSPSPGSTSSRPPQRRSPCRSNRLDAYVVFPPSPIPQHLALSFTSRSLSPCANIQLMIKELWLFSSLLFFPSLSDPHILISHVPPPFYHRPLLSRFALLFHSFLDLFTRVSIRLLSSNMLLLCSTGDFNKQYRAGETIITLQGL